ncbi:hypothetical protein CFN16_04800 [Pseudomonas fluorescens]|uniref:DUF4123 domain-containing protein n=1 Tax=Pseudomonas fluorescens TaxID=294 RepID=A0A345USL7_PSEFL|nr:DUF4123 domain-containing protein [Pseudomonas fluorescens]AXJ03469.1 hypothetical protein CFN16_04800 [Pseudomonas fluorescens]WJK11014.1 DUF4123 domain-containing protein [Pseudomonas fluorescens]
MNNASKANFLLIDGVLRPNAIASLYQLGEPLEIEPLYLGTRWAELMDLGPILVKPSSSTSMISQTYQNANHQIDASLLYSSAPMSVVADHLRRYIAPSDVLGGNGMLRFADPLVTRYWLGSYQGEHLNVILGPIESWSIPERPHSWEANPAVQWLNFLRTSAPLAWQDSYAQLGQTQLDALGHAARWQFMERLHENFEQYHPRHLATLKLSSRTQWFDERLDEAQAWGLSSERSLAIWVEYSLRWGAGFTEHVNEPYQNWLARTPEASRLAPEIRIQKMDNDCLDIEINKEV